MVIALVSTPPIRTLPLCGSTSRVSRLKMVDFPAPEAPTNAVVWPAFAVRSKPFNTFVSP